MKDTGHTIRLAKEVDLCAYVVFFLGYYKYWLNFTLYQIFY